MHASPSHSETIERSARAVGRYFERYLAGFHEITRRAGRRFGRAEWHEAQADVQERLEVYNKCVSQAAAAIQPALDRLPEPRALWIEVKARFASRANGLNFELARTFFNSVTRRIFATVGVDARTEFTSLDLAIHDWEPDPTILHCHRGGSLRSLLSRALADFGDRLSFEALTDDVDLAAARAEQRVRETFGDARVESIEFLRSIFYRNKAAYLMGRMKVGERGLPLIVSFESSPAGARIDAVLTREAEASILFSFTRSYFHVDAECPRQLIVFLKAIMPLKPVSDLYTALGFNKHGKTELYRSLQRHLGRERDRFELARGDRGMVMLVFTLPSYDRVFKIIRDRFEYPKNVTADEVMERYRLVHRLDRVGRLVEAQTFRQLEFDVDRFDEALLTELRAEAGKVVTQRADRLVFTHLYSERKVQPLNLFLREANEEQARRAVLDYGAAIKELAAANIFPGDFLLKNFGVTRHGRVVFYDYDELCLLSDCRFRRMPQAQSPEQEMASEPWFSVAPNDVFPEEFPRFLGLDGPLLRLFESRHGDLFQPEFWTGLQELHRAGVLLSFYPYPQSERLRAEA